MCGITGRWGQPPDDGGVAERTAAQIASQGPDDGGVWIDPDAGLALAHRRLAVLGVLLTRMALT